MKHGKKIISVIAVTVMVLGLCFGLISINPIISNAAGNCIVRVKLDSLGRVSTVKLGINGSYTLPNGSYLDQGSYTAYITDGKIALRDSAGSNVYTSESGYIKLTKRNTQASGIKIGNYEYLGDFVLAKNGSYIEVPLLYYPGYSAKDNNGNKLETEDGTNHVLRINLQNGTDTVKIKYSGLWSFKLADAVTILTLLGMAALWFYHKRRNLI